MFKDFLKNAMNIKTRSLVVVVIVILAISGFFIWSLVKPEKDALLESASKTKRISPSLDSLPGAGEADVIYNPLQEKANQEKAASALDSGTSAVATLLNPEKDGYDRGGFGALNDGTGRCGDECYNEQGFDANGFDRNGYNKDGFDRNGLDKNGYNKDGFDRFGYDKDGYDKDGFDRFGFDKDGFDRTGCNRQGFDRKGKPCVKVGPDCYTEAGLDVNGCNRQGLGPDGKPCYGADGFNAKGFDKCGYDRDGYNQDGFDRNGCNRQGLDRAGKPCYGPDGFNADGLNRLGLDKDGYDKNGFKNGFDRNGLDKDGYDKDGFDKNGCNRQGLNREGKPCYNAQGYTEDGYDRQGYNKDGYDRNGLDKNGYDPAGYDKDGYDRQGYDKDGYDRDGFNRAGCNRQGMNREGKPCTGAAEDLLSGLISTGDGGQQNAPLDSARSAAADYARLQAEQQAVENARLAEMDADQRAQMIADEQARLAAYESLMTTQAQAILQAWAPPKQTYVAGNVPKEDKNTQPEKKQNPYGLAAAGEGPIIGKAGDVLYAVIQSSVNSDQPGPVLAEIVSGPLAGSRVMGTFERQDKKVFIRFNLLNMPDVPQSIAIDAVAVDPDTALTGLATDVDNHYVAKYGTLIAASFLQGMGEAVETSIGTPELTGDNGAIIASQVAATTQDQAIVGLGKAGQRIAEEIDKSDIQPTVTVDSGTGVGLLLMADLRVEEPPAGFVLRAAAPLAPNSKGQPTATTPTPTPTATEDQPLVPRNQEQIIVSPGTSAAVPQTPM